MTVLIKSEFQWILFVSLIIVIACKKITAKNDGGPVPEQGEYYFPGNDLEPVVAYTNNSEATFSDNIENDVSIFLYTRKNSDSKTQLYTNNLTALLNSPFDPLFETKLIIHGYSTDTASYFVQNIKNAYLAIGEYNIIAIDWGVLAQAPNYLSASRNTMDVGKYVALFIDFLVLQGGLVLNKLHVIGHSLGAHTAGIVGKNIKTGVIRRITSLDAALPLYIAVSDDWKITKNDADFVDGIHTCGGFLGMKNSVGDIDFYPNNGLFPQPGCGLDVLGTCSHARGYQYYIESVINPSGFPTVGCESVSQATTSNCNIKNVTTPYMGNAAIIIPNSNVTIYHTTTNSDPPFAKNVSLFK